MCFRPVIVVGTLLIACPVAFAQDEFGPSETAPATNAGELGAASPDEPADALQEIELPSAGTARGALLAAPGGAAGIGNDDVVDMVNAEFGDATIRAAIEANATRFDVSPRALLALKSAGVPETVIEAMLAAEALRREAAAAPQQQPADAAPPAGVAENPAQPALPMSPEALAMLSQVVEQLAARPGQPEPAPTIDLDASTPPHAGPGPHAWVADGERKTALPPTIAQVAVTDSKGNGATALKTLQGIGGKALAFANPALGIATEIGGFFRPGDPTVTAVWALPGATATRSLAPETVFEVEFADIPGVNPDDYRPAIVELVPTRDNYRLVGAAKTKGEIDGIPTGPIIEEAVAAETTQLERGRYRVSLASPVRAGEYALVLRPLETKKKRRAETSLGELMGAGSGEILYMTWDFSIAL